MTDRVHKEKVITPIGTGFVEIIVPRLMQEAFEAYKKRNFRRSYFQVSPWENSHAAAANVLTATAIEAYRNRIYYLEKEEISKYVPSDISKVFAKKLLSFPSQSLKSTIEEVFVIRDIIVHSHIYEVDVLLSKENWRMINYSHIKLSGYGDAKFKRSVNIERGKTKLMGFNVQPLKIGFEDLFKVLLVFDLFAGIAERAFGRGYVAFHLHFERPDNSWVENLSELLTYYYDQIPNSEFTEQADRLAKELRKDFGSFLTDTGDYFITNTCPKCFALGFRKSKRVCRCDICKSKMGF